MIAQPPLELPVDTPVLLVDLNALAEVHQCSDARKAQTASQADRLTFLPELEKQLATLSNALYVIWCCQKGPTIELNSSAPNLGQRPGIAVTPEEASYTDWQLRAIQRTLADWRGPLAWIGTAFSGKERTWASSRLAEGAPTWLVDIDETGLSEEIIAGLLEWAKEVKKR